MNRTTDHPTTRRNGESRQSRKIREGFKMDTAGEDTHRGNFVIYLVCHFCKHRNRKTMDRFFLSQCRRSSRKRRRRIKTYIIGFFFSFFAFDSCRPFTTFQTLVFHLRKRSTHRIDFGGKRHGTELFAPPFFFVTYRMETTTGKGLDWLEETNIKLFPKKL